MWIVQLALRRPRDVSRRGDGGECGAGNRARDRAVARPATGCRRSPDQITRRRLAGAGFARYSSISIFGEGTMTRAEVNFTFFIFFHFRPQVFPLSVV